MIDLKHIYWTAQLLIHQHGIKARDEANQKLQYFLEADDVKASSLWLYIGGAIEDLQMTPLSSPFKDR